MAPVMRMECDSHKRFIRSVEARNLLASIIISPLPHSHGVSFSLCDPSVHIKD